MSKKLAVCVVLFSVLCPLSISYAMGSAPIIKESRVTAEAFASGTYKIYKNNDLGYSFKYPKKWYLEETPAYRRGGALEFELANFDWHKESYPPMEERVLISGFIWRDTNDAFPRNSDEIITRIIKNHQEVTKSNPFEKYDIKEIDKFEVVNGTVFHVTGKQSHYKEKDSKYDVWVIYFHLKNGSLYFRDLTKMTPANLMVAIFPAESDEETFMRIMKSIIIY